jgi:hypothetical protein
MHVDESPISDSSGLGHTGTLDSANNPDYQTDAPAGYSAGSYVFTSDKITFGDHADFSPEAGASGVISISIWVKFTSVDTSNGGRTWVVTKGNTSNFEYQIQALGDGSNAHFKANVYDSSATEIGSITGTTNISTGTWYHIAFTWDDGANSSILYVNSVSEGSAGAFGLAAADKTSSLMFGQRGDGAGNSLAGSITEFALFARVLTPSEVSTIYTQGLQGTFGAHTNIIRNATIRNATIN